MKKVVSNTGEVITFLVEGVRHDKNAKEYDIDENGVIMKDEHARLIADRLGSQVTVSDIDVESAKKEAEAALKNAEAPKDTEDKTPAKKEAEAALEGPQASDAIKAYAEENGIDLTTVTGTGANGNILKKDVEAAIAAKEE